MIDKWVYVGWSDAGHTFVHIKFDGERLSITGVEGPKSNGDCTGGCGQIKLNITTPQKGIDVPKLSEIWKRWHLNDMRPGCQHQMELGWDKLPIDETKPTNAYGKHFDGQKFDNWNMLTWVTRKEHPKGLLCEPCPTCGHRYGTSWLHENVPEDVISFLESLPECLAPKGWN